MDFQVSHSVINKALFAKSDLNYSCERATASTGAAVICGGAIIYSFGGTITHALPWQPHHRSAYSIIILSFLAFRLRLIAKWTDIKSFSSHFILQRHDISSWQKKNGFNVSSLTKEWSRENRNVFLNMDFIRGVPFLPVSAGLMKIRWIIL